MSEMNNRLTYDFAAALRGEELKEVERSAPGPDRPSYDFAAMLRQSEELVPSRPTAEETVEAATPPARERGWPRELSISAEGMKLALKSYLSTWLNRTKVSFLTELGVGAGAGFLANMAFTELVAKSPEAAKLLPLVLTETQIIGGTMAGLVEAGALGVLADRNKLEIAGKYARALSLAERIAVTKSADGLIDKSLLGFASLTKAARDILTRPATAGFTAGTWLYAALAGAGVFGDAVIPAAAGGGEGLADPGSVDGSIGGQVGGLSSEDGSVGAVIQPPAEIGGTGAQPAPEVVPGAGVLPAEDLLPQPGDAEAIARQAAEAAEAARQAALETATRVVEVQPNDTLTDLVARAGGDPYGADFTNTVLQSADVLTGPQNPNRDMAQALIDFIKAHPDGVNWRDAVNGVGDLAKETVGGMPLKDAIAQATRMIYPGQEIKVVVGAALQ